MREIVFSSITDPPFVKVFTGIQFCTRLTIVKVPQISEAGTLRIIGEWNNKRRAIH